MAWNPDGTQLLTGCEEKLARVFDVSAAKEIIAYAHDGPVLSVAWSPAGTQYATGSADGCARVFARTGAKLYVCEHRARVSSVAWNAEGTELSTGCEDDAARVFWPVETFGFDEERPRRNSC